MLPGLRGSGRGDRSRGCGEKLRNVSPMSWKRQNRKGNAICFSASNEFGHATSIGQAMEFIRPGSVGARRLQAGRGSCSIDLMLRIARRLNSKRRFSPEEPAGSSPIRTWLNARLEGYYHYPLDRIEVVPNGVPLTDFRPDPEARRLRRKSLRLHDDEIAVLFVGSGWERKGLRYAAKLSTC